MNYSMNLEYLTILFINDILKVLRNLVKTAKTVHDQKLDR